MEITCIQQRSVKIFRGILASIEVWAVTQTMTWLVAGAIALLPFVSSSAIAASLQGPQLTEQPATLVGPRADAPIAIYLRPAPNQPNVGYAISGDAVMVLEQVGDYLSEGDQNATWSHIRLEKAPYTEGWLRGRFLAFDSPLIEPSNLAESD